MKKMMMTLVAMLTIAVSAHAMSYEQARNEALFLTDKMAYELNLTDEQYEAAYEINLDYLMGVTSRDDVFGTYWERRNLDLSYILYDWQWNAFLAASYFYRPLFWEAGYWHFGIYARYPHRDYFYFGRPHFYATYRGGHAWHLHGSHGYYYGQRSHFRAPAGRTHIGMHDRWTRGDFRGTHHSSSRVTDRNGRGAFGSGNRSLEHNNRSLEHSNRSLERTNRSLERSNRSLERSNRSLERSNRTLERSNRTLERSNRTIERSNSSSPSRTFGGSSAGRSSMGTMGTSRSNSFGSSSRSSSFGGGSHGGSFGGGSHSSGSVGGSHSGGRR